MRKEIIFAIIFGVILGGVILFGINLANNASSTASDTDSATSPTPTAGTPTVSAVSLVISSPQDHSVTTAKKLTLTGKSTPGATIAVITELDDIILTLPQEGTFSTEINLVGGENNIHVTELLPDLTTNSQTIQVIQTNTLPE